MGIVVRIFCCGISHLLFWPGRHCPSPSTFFFLSCHNINLLHQGKPSFVRIYRDYIVGDFVFGTLFAAIGSYAAFRPTVRSNICELLSRQPDMLRDFIDLGLTLENCEPWFERGVFAFMVILIVITVIRVSNFCLNGWR
jgi:hypothetical protein